MPARATSLSPAAELVKDGFAVIDGVRLEGYDAWCGQFGRILDSTVVQWRPDARTYLSGHEEVPLHTDHPKVETISWLCARQDVSDGTSILVDARRAILEGGVVEELAGLELECPVLESLEPAMTWPVCSGPGPNVYYSPWRTPRGPNLKAWNHLQACINQAPRIAIRLRPGQVLVIDNRRMLHGRSAVQEGSARLLHRRWMSHG